MNAAAGRRSRNPLAGMALLLVALATACTRAPDEAFPGYAEGENLRLSSPIAGTVLKLHLQRGDHAGADAPAFVLEQSSERAAREEADARVRRARAQWVDLRQGQRPDELAAIRAQRDQAAAALALANADLGRAERLVAERFYAPATADQLRANVARDRARVSEIDAQLRTASHGARVQAIAAAEQEVHAAEALLAQAQWKVTQKTQRTPLAGDVVDVLFREGEWVPAGAAVLTLLPPANIKARFFVPQAVLGRIALGAPVSLACDGCGAPINATISFIAREAEYTAPIIFSKENRARLVFMVEARPALADAPRLHPGQPLEVRLAATASGAPP